MPHSNQVRSYQLTDDGIKIGALDLAGNIWEWTQSMWLGYPQASGMIVDDVAAGSYFDPASCLSLRGGSHNTTSGDLACAARYGVRPTVGLGLGFRCCVAPHR